MILTGKIVSNSINLESYFGEDNLSNYNSENLRSEKLKQ